MQGAPEGRNSPRREESLPKGTIDPIRDIRAVYGRHQLKRTGKIATASSLIGLLGLALAAPAATAAQTEPFVSAAAWYWEEQTSQKVVDPTSGGEVAAIELANPFCPTAPGGLGGTEQTCKAGRLPVEVVGADYESPDKISAVAFDLSLIPIGSTVKEFTATFLEADDEQSEPVNAEGKALQACVVEQFFGDGEAREYEEAPRHACTDLDPIAKRKPAKVKGDDERFEYTFDLTTFAQGWVEAGAPVSAIMLYPAQPKDQGPDDANWRTVLVGPAEENGVVTNLVYTPSEVEAFPDLGGDVGGDVGSFDTGSTGSFDTGSTGFDSGTTSAGSVGSTPPAAETPTEDAGTDEPVAAPPSELAAEEVPTTGGLPGYVWLALLAGFIGFSLVRSIVLEQAAGIRPDGVLAQIRRINGGRATAAVTASSSGARFSGVMEGLKGLAGKATSFSDKLPFKRKA